MPSARCNGIEIEYEEFGSRSDPALLLVMGLGAQMILWDEELCQLLADAGHRVVRFDNRDVGLSSKLDHLGTPKIAELMGRAAQGETPDVPYQLADMADDARGLLEALDIDAAHVVGASMGGMIAQTLALQSPERVLSLTSIMSTSGKPGLEAPRPDAVARLMAPPPQDREAAAEQSVTNSRVFGSPGFPRDEGRIRRRALRAFDRCSHPAGSARQLAAILGSPPRYGALAELRIPALVIHGRDDPLVPCAHGVDTHERLVGSDLVLIDGMGHDLPAGVWQRIADSIGKVTQRG